MKNSFLNRRFGTLLKGLAIVLAGCLSAACSKDEGPAKPLGITLRDQALVLERSETGCLRFAFSSWSSHWSLVRAELVAEAGGDIVSGCTVAGWGGPVDGVFSVYITAPDTSDAFDEQVCLSVEVSGQRMLSEPFTLRSAAAVNAELPVVYVTATQPVVDTEN